MLYSEEFKELLEYCDNKILNTTEALRYTCLDTTFDYEIEISEYKWISEGILKVERLNSKFEIHFYVDLYFFRESLEDLLFSEDNFKYFTDIGFIPYFHAISSDIINKHNIKKLDFNYKINSDLSLLFNLELSIDVYNYLICLPYYENKINIYKRLKNNELFFTKLDIDEDLLKNLVLETGNKLKLFYPCNVYLNISSKNIVKLLNIVYTYHIDRITINLDKCQMSKAISVIEKHIEYLEENGIQKIKLPIMYFVYMDSDEYMRRKHMPEIYKLKNFTKFYNMYVVDRG